MDTLSALRRKRDEIASTIAAYEAKIADARTDLAALDQAARLFDPGAESDEPSIRRELGWRRSYIPQLRRGSKYQRNFFI
jgi:hypothetical protein